MQLPPLIAIRKDVMLGKPCLEGTRIPVYLILEKLDKFAELKLSELTGVPAKAAEITKEEPKVKHLDVILAIVQGTPVQYDFTLTGTWHDYEHNTGMSPVDHPEYNWRIKPQPEPKRTVVIGKRTVVAPEVEAPAIGSEYWVMYCDYIEEWNNDSADFALLLEGRVFLDAKDGRTCQVAIQALLLGKD